MIYARFIRFLFPLVLAMVALELGGQVLTGGMARVPRATETLAAFGLAWGLMSFLTSSLWQVRQLGLVLAENRPATVSILRFVSILSLTLACLLCLLALSPLGPWVIEGLHGVDPTLGSIVRHAILCLLPLPLISGGTHLCSGVLLRVRRTEIISAATLCSICASIVSVFLLLPMDFVREQPIRLPVLVTYIGTTVEFAIVLVGYFRFARPALDASGKAPGVPYVARFFWPLALIMAVQGMSRPRHFL